MIRIALRGGEWNGTVQIFNRRAWEMIGDDLTAKHWR